MDHKSVNPQKKIKILVSDFRLGRGRIMPDGRLNSFEEFNYGDKFAEFLNYYSSGAFREYEVELIINGDFLHFLQVDFRGHYLTSITESVALELLKTIIAGHEIVFSAMKEFLLNQNKKITYILGNHDQAMMFQNCRNYLDQFIGVPLQYKNIAYIIDGIHIEHGHMHESYNRLNPRKLFIRHGYIEPILNLPLGSHLFVHLVLKIKEKYPYIGKMRPYRLLFKWSLFNKPILIFDVFKLLLQSLFTIDRTSSWSLLKIIKTIFSSAWNLNLSQIARKILNEDRIHTVVFSHTHIYDYKKWGPQKEYFNTGSWTESISLDVTSLGKRTKLTYVMFEYVEGDSNPRGRLKEWKGFHRIEEDVVVA